MKVWITKYALAAGILEFEVEDSAVDGEMLALKRTPQHFLQFLHRPDWHKSRELAVARAEDMRKAKLSSLKKQITKLEKITFANAKESADV